MKALPTAGHSSGNKEGCQHELAPMSQKLSPQIGHLLHRGWRVLAEVHTGIWILELMGLVMPAGVLTFIVAFLGEHTPAMLAIVFFVILTATILITLASLGREAPIVDVPHRSPLNLHTTTSGAASAASFRSSWQEVLPPLSKNPLLPEELPLNHDARERLRGYYKGLSTAEGDRLSQPYKGKEIQISGEVKNISINDSGFAIVWLREEFPLSTIMEFRGEQVKTIETLHPGNSVTIIGKIASASLHDLQLAECRLVSRS